MALIYGAGPHECDEYDPWSNVTHCEGCGVPIYDSGPLCGDCALEYLLDDLEVDNDVS